MNHIDELRDFVRLPSYAAHPTGRPAAADYAQKLLEDTGFRVWRHGAADAPVLFAELAGESGRWLLFYNHYDVTAPGDEAAWSVPPFSAEVKDSVMYGRGTSDHKASFVARVAAIRELLKQGGRLPVGIRFLVDSEEESGSPGLEDILRAHGPELQADGGLYSGGALDEKERPVIRAGSKGMCSLRLSVTTAAQHLHSKWAVLVPNAAWRLIAALNTMYEPETGRVLIPGFLDGVRPVTDLEREALAELDFGFDEFSEAVGMRHAAPGVTESNVLERIMFAPTFNLAYFSAGNGGRTVLPADAVAILDVRLVPDQDTGAMRELIASHLEANGFSDVKIETLGGSNPDKCDLGDPVVRALRVAAEETYGQRPQVHPSGAGSGPRYLFKKYLGISLVQDPGASWLGSNDHAADENIRLADYLANIELTRRFITHYARFAAES